MNVDDAIEHLRLEDATPDGGCCDEAKLAILTELHRQAAAMDRVRVLAERVAPKYLAVVSASEILRALDGESS